MLYYFVAAYKRTIDVLLFRRFSPINSRQVVIVASLRCCSTALLEAGLSDGSTHAASHAPVLSKSRAVVGL